MQRYLCLDCGQSFSSERRPRKLQQILFEAYLYHRNTLEDLHRIYHRDREWIQRQIHEYVPEDFPVNPREVVLVIDATFFGKRSDKFGLLVAKDTRSMKPVGYRFIQTETLDEYALMLKRLRLKGFVIRAVTVDGKRGLFGLFGDLPVQMCHFHQQAIVTRYLTRKPKIPASIDLKRVASYLGRVNACRFQILLDAWYQRHAVFLEEKVEDESRRGWHYKHKRLRSAYRSLRNNFPYLFTYRSYPELKIHHTTNALDGGLFSPLKALLKIH
ncbi:IS256 family transposase, variant Zn-binding type, partial [Nitratifractor sp.]